MNYHVIYLGNTGIVTPVNLHVKIMGILGIPKIKTWDLSCKLHGNVRYCDSCCLHVKTMGILGISNFTWDLQEY